MLSTFSLDTVPAARRPEVLRDAFALYSLPIHITIQRAHDVRGSFSAGALGRIRVERFSVAGIAGTASRSMTTADSAVEPAVTLHCLDRGGLQVRQDGRTSYLAARSMVLTSADSALVMVQDRECAMTTITVPYRDLRLPPDALRAALNRPLAAAEPVAGTTAAMVHRLVTDMRDTPEQPWDVLEEAVGALVRALVLLTAGHEREARRPLAESLGDRVLHYVEQHALDESVDAARIAAAHSISVRYLYLILHRRGVSLGDHVRSRRLDHAAELLVDPAAAGLTIAEIAHRSGFADHAHFSRTFRLRFDTSPREWRHRAGSQPGDRS